MAQDQSAFLYWLSTWGLDFPNNKILFWIFKIVSQWDGSAHKAARSQAWLPECHPQNPHEGRREPTLASYPLGSTRLVSHVDTHALVHVCTCSPNILKKKTAVLESGSFQIWSRCWAMLILILGSPTPFFPYAGFPPFEAVVLSLWASTLWGSHISYYITIHNSRKVTLWSHNATILWPGAQHEELC